MTRPFWLGLIAVLLLCSGCFTTAHDQSLLPALAPAPLQPPPPVTAEQVNTDNCHQKAEELLAEIDWDAQQNVLQPASPAARK